MKDSRKQNASQTARAIRPGIRGANRTKPSPQMVRAQAPATVANVAVGFDILGFAIGRLYETVEVRRIPTPGKVTIAPIANYPDLPLSPKKNTASAGLVRLLKERNLKHGFHLVLEKNIPIGSGLGGSSASAVAAVFAASALLDEPLTMIEIFDYSLTGEAVASGSRHGDNIAPCLWGGLQLIRGCDPADIVSVPFPKGLHCVVVHPQLRIDTKSARKILAPSLSLTTHIEQSANLAGFLLGCFNSDYSLIKRSLKDVVIEHQRSKLVPGFYDVQKSAVRAGALGCSLSGSGPTVFALAESIKAAEIIQRAMLKSFASVGLDDCRSWVSGIQKDGVKIVGVQK